MRLLHSARRGYSVMGDTLRDDGIVRRDRWGHNGQDACLVNFLKTKVAKFPKKFMLDG